jgi:site-specific recombinase XerD
MFFTYMCKKKGYNAPEECDLAFLRGIKLTDLYSFINYLTKVRGDKPTTRARKVSSIRSFFKYAHNKVGIIPENPASQLDSPKLSKKLPRYLEIQDSKDLLTSIDGDHKERDYCMIVLFLNCGMRVSELVGIDLNDVDRDFRSLTVTGKGNKQRIVYLNTACKEALSDYYTERMSERYINLTTRALFLSNRDQRISVKTVQWLVYKYLELAGLESKHYSVHKLRHTAATLMYQSGNVDVRVLKDILGHEQLNTTQIYTHVSNRSMEEAMEHNPLATQKSLPKDNFTPLDKKDATDNEN